MTRDELRRRVWSQLLNELGCDWDGIINNLQDEDGREYSHDERERAMRAIGEVAAVVIKRAGRAG